MQAADSTLFPNRYHVRGRSWLAADLERFGPHSTAAAALTLAQADRYCRRLTRQHGENFVVASWGLPRAIRRQFYRIYAYCRWADDLADEITDRETSRYLLDWWQESLEQCYRDRATHPVFVSLRETIGEYQIPMEPFADLLRAFRQDQQTTRYATFAELRQYCRWSADSVGRIILHLANCCDDGRCRLADAVCTGLQLANFCQDAAEDFARGRIYFPKEDLERYGCAESDFGRSSATSAMCRLVKFEVDRAEAFLQEGRDLIMQVPGWLARDIDLFISGGCEILRLIRLVDYDVWFRRPTIGRWSKLNLLARVWFFASRQRQTSGENDSR